MIATQGKRLLFFILLIGYPISLLFAQTYSFDRYTVEDGLSQSNVIELLQDKKGNLWIATESGVSRFDGKNFQNYSTADGLADNNISCMLMDKKGTLWFGHSSGTISKFDGQKFSVVNTGELFNNKKIFAIFQDTSGHIWLSVEAIGVACLLNAEGDFKKETNYKIYKSKDGLSAYVFSITQTKDGKLWFLTDIGIKYFIPDENKFDFFRVPDLPASQVISMCEDSKGNYWFGTYAPGEAVVAKYNPKEKKTQIFKTPTLVRAIKEDSKGNIWISAWGGGLLRYNGKGMTVFNTENGLSVNKITSIYEDREKNIILGTFGGGMIIFKGEKFISYTRNNGLLSNQVMAIQQDKSGNYWFGTNEGISVYDPDENKFQQYEKINNLPKVGVKALAADRYGNMWVGTLGNDVFKYDPYSKRFIAVTALTALTTDIITALCVDHSNMVWTGTADGLVVYDQGSGSARHYRTTDGLAGNDISVLFEDSKKNIWVGCKGRGLNRFNGSKFKTFSKDEGFTHNNPVTVAEDKTGNIWVGTEGGGVYRYDGVTFKNFRTLDGLLSDFITLITVDEKNNIWIGTNKGLNKYESSTQSFYSYNKFDGFTAIETKPNAVYKDHEERIWFGTVNGVTCYTPRYDKLNISEPITSINKVKVNDKEIIRSSSSEETVFSYKENSFVFDYVGVCISNPDMVRYQVMLEGIDADFRPPFKQTTEKYTNLSPGHYAFKVKACNNAGVWNEQPASFRFYIQPPWYRTWWAYLIFITGGISIFVFYVKVRERNLVKEKQVLEEKVAERTAEVVEKNKQLDEKNKDITASIRYAKRIQEAILPPDEYVKKFLPQTFVLFKPKDIVSGDFYWVYNVNPESKVTTPMEEEPGDIVLFAAVDCTGHGVPGAFMSIIGHSLLDQVVNTYHITQPAAILDALNKSVSDTLRQSYIEDQSVKDGMDIALCSFNRKTNVLEYAGAFNPMFLVQKGEVKEIKADKFPIGNLKIGEQKRFTNHSFQLEKDDAVYIFSDGYADQFGGPQGKKFKYKQLQNILLSIQHMSMEEQEKALDKTIEDWKGDLEQVDDILIIGTRL